MSKSDIIQEQYIDLQHGLIGALDTVIWRSSARIIEILLTDQLIDCNNFHIQEEQLGGFGIMLLLKKKSIEVQSQIILSKKGYIYEESKNQQEFFRKGYEVMERLNYPAIRLDAALSSKEANEYVSNLESNLHQKGSEQNRLFYRINSIDINQTGRAR